MDDLKTIIYRVGHSGPMDKRVAEDELKAIHGRIIAIAGRALDNDGDNKSGAKSMRAALHQIVRTLSEDFVASGGTK